MNLRRRQTLALAWILLPLSFGGISCGGQGDQQAEQADGTFYDTGQEILGDPGAAVAMVGGEPVTLAEIDLVATFWNQSGSEEARAAENHKALQHAALDHLIDQLVLAREAHRLGIVAPDSIVDLMVAQWNAQFEGPADRDEKLASRNVTFEQVRGKFAQDVVVQNLVGRVITDTLEVPPADVRAYYDEHPEYFETTEVHARHVLLMTDADAPPESLAAAREQIEAIRGQAVDGADFERLAREFSECPSSSQGGDLGYFRRSQMVAPFADAAFSLQPGEISEVVETQFGYHVVKVEDRRNEGFQPFEEAAPTIERYLGGQLLQEAVDRYADSLRAQVEIEIKLPL